MLHKYKQLNSEKLLLDCQFTGLPESSGKEKKIEGQCMRNFMGIAICFLVFCMGCTRDPFSRYPESIKNASPDRNPFYISVSDFKDQIISEDVANIKIDDNSWEAFVDDDFLLEVEGHVFLDNKDFDRFEIDLMSPTLVNEDYDFYRVTDPPSSSRGEQRYVFRWNPSQSFFLGDNFERTINLNFRLHITADQNIDVFEVFPVVIKTPRPEIISIEQPLSVLDRGLCKVKIRVFDKGSGEHPPVINFINTDSSYDILDLISFSRVDQDEEDPYTWEFEYDFTPPLLDTTSQLPYTYDILVMSRFGVSAIERSQIIVVSDAGHFPQITGPASMTVYKGRSHHFRLFVENPFGGDLSINENISPDLFNVPGHFISHQIEQRDDGFDIHFVWTVPDIIEAESNEYDLNIEMFNEFDHNGELFVRQVSHKIAARILDFPTDTERIVIDSTRDAKSNVESSITQIR